MTKLAARTRTLLAIVGLAACDGGPSVDPTGDPVRICDGGQDVRLAVRMAGGGPSLAGQTMLAENGWQFLLVDGACHASVLRSNNEPLRELTLTAQQEQTLSAALQLSNWQGLVGSHPGGCPDAASISYRFGTARIDGPTCGLDAGDPLETLNASFSVQLEGLYAAGAPAGGDLRYVVLRESGSPRDPRPPAAWPLAVLLESIALPGDASTLYTPGDSRLATGADADALRAIRVNRDAAPGTGVTYSFTRVAGPDGTNYQLYVRDAVPGEQPNGLLPVGTF